MQPHLSDLMHDSVALLGQMMEGFLDATSGSILIEGRSVHSSMQGNAGLVGICPQHDLLWESLTGREHLLFYARLHAFTVSEKPERRQTLPTCTTGACCCCFACCNTAPHVELSLHFV